MTQFHVGEVIRELRMQRGVTQSQLCEGICDVVSMSRIENGKQQPRRAILVLLLQRLGVAEEQYHGLCSFDDLALEELKLAIRNANARFDYRAALELLDKLIANYDCSGSIMEQFVLWTQAINGKRNEAEVVPYPPDEKLVLLNKAIKCTVPSLNISDIGQSLLGLDEVKIIMSIANTSSDIGLLEEAVRIYSQLLTYIENNCYSLSEKPMLIALVTYNYSKTLGTLGHPDEELTISQIGINVCARAGHTRRLGDLLMNKSCALLKLGNLSESKELAIQSYYIMKATNTLTHVDIIKNHLITIYNWDPEQT